MDYSSNNHLSAFGMGSILGAVISSLYFKNRNKKQINAVHKDIQKVKLVIQLIDWICEEGQELDVDDFVLQYKEKISFIDIVTE